MADFTSSNSRGGLYEAGIVLTKPNLSIKDKSIVGDLGSEDYMTFAFTDDNNDTEPITLEICQNICEEDTDNIDCFSLVTLTFDSSQRKQMVEYLRQVATILERKV